MGESVHTNTRVPAIILIVCLPLIASKGLLYFALALESVNPQASALIGLVGVMAFLILFWPALLLIEPFAIGASIWYTSRFNDSIRGLIVCWLIVLMHTAVLISYLRLGR